MGVLTTLHAEPPEAALNIKRRITLSLGYDEDFNSNEGMKHLPLTTIQGYSWVFDQVSKITSGEWSRGALVAADIILHMPYLGQYFNHADSNWFFEEKWWPYLPAYHEFGHARALRAFSTAKFKSYMMKVVGNNLQFNESSVLWYYLNSLKYMGLNYTAVTYYDSTLLNFRNHTQALAFWAGGLNNETRLSKEIADLTYRFNGHIAYFGPYLRGKISAISYTAKTMSGNFDFGGASDIEQIVAYYKKENKNFNMSHIQYGGWVGALLSSSTYSFIKGYWDFIHTGDPTVKTFTWNGIRLPDLNLYFTRNGLSLEVVTGYQINPNMWFNLGVETVYYPRFSGMEFTPSVRYVVPTKMYGMFDFDIGLVLNTYVYLGGHVGIEWTDPVNPITLQAKVILHNAGTYLGERNITYSRATDYQTEFMLSASLNY